MWTVTRLGELPGSNKSNISFMNKEGTSTNCGVGCGFKPQPRQVSAPPMLVDASDGCKYVGQKGSITMLATIQSAGVASEVNLRNSAQARKCASKKSTLALKPQGSQDGPTAILTTRKCHTQRRIWWTKSTEVINSNHRKLNSIWGVLHLWQASRLSTLTIISSNVKHSQMAPEIQCRGISGPTKSPGALQL